MIQLDRAVSGARLGNSKSEVRTALGEPRRVIKRDGLFGPTTTFRYRGGLRVIFLNGRVTLAGTTGRGDRTNRGVGVGSSEQAVRKRVPVSTARRSRAPGSAAAARSSRASAGRSSSSRQGRVTRADVAILID